MNLREKAEALIKLIDKGVELQSELSTMKENTEFPFTASELSAKEDQIDMVIQSISVMQKAIADHFKIQ